MVEHKFTNIRTGARLAVAAWLALACGSRFQADFSGAGGGGSAGTDSASGSGGSKAGTGGASSSGTGGSAGKGGGAGGDGSGGTPSTSGGASTGGSAGASGGTSGAGDGGSAGGGTPNTAGTSGSGGGGTGGTGGVVVVQELIDEGYVPIRQDLGTVDAWTWFYHDGWLIPFDASLGTLESVTIEQTIDLDFEIPPGTLGNSFRYFAWFFKDDGLRTLSSRDMSFPISNVSMTDTYSWTEPGSEAWSEAGWRYYFEVRGQETPFTFRHVARITYHYVPAE